MQKKYITEIKSHIFLPLSLKYFENLICSKIDRFTKRKVIRFKKKMFLQVQCNAYQLEQFLSHP